MKAFNFSLMHLVYLLVGMLITSLTTNAAVPVIDSPLTASATIDQAFSYTITTLSNDAILYGTSSNLPDGITRTGATLSGIPTEAGEFNIRLDATNADGTDSKILVLTVSNPTPEITTGLEFTGRVGESFSCTIPASSSPDSFSEIGLSAIDGLTLDAATGIISGTPTVDAIADVLVSATNSAGTGSANIRITILPALTAPSQPSVEIVSPSPISNTIIEGTDSQLTVVANVTPQPGEIIDVVFVRWVNPPAPLSQIIVADMALLSTDSTTGTETYTADVNIGFNSNDRQVGGGDIRLEVVAYQTNAVGSADAGTALVAFTVKPILEFLFPTEDFAMDSVVVGDVFASVRLNTNQFSSVTARIAGSSVVETVTINSLSSNGVYNFSSSQRIDFPGLYDIRITGLDTNGNTTVIERRILISDALAEPVAFLSSPTPGFINEVFSGAILSYIETDRQPRTVNNVGVVGYDVTYELALISGGQGYFPRDATDVTILATDALGVTIGVTGVDVVNGRVDALPDDFDVFYPIGAPEWNTSGNAIMDDLSDPGRNGWISIAGQFFKANSELDSYKIFVNGENVTPGTGNLDPFLGAVDVPVAFYPGTGRGSPLPGDYIAYAQVTDKQGEVGTSEPLSFSIVPYDPIEITITREGVGDIEQGASDIFIAQVTSTQPINTVQFFDSDSTSLGLASSIVIDGQTVYRFVHTFSQQGPGAIYAVATAFNQQSSRSNSIPFNVTPLNDLSVVINSPAADVTVFENESLTFVASAVATPGVEKVEWVVNNEVKETDTSEPYEYTPKFDTIGTYRVLARGTDNFGNLVDSSVITVTVLASDLTVSFISPVGDQTLVQGETLTFTVFPSASIGIARVEWLVDGLLLDGEIDTASPYSLTYSFATSGPSSVIARAYDTVDNIASTAITVDVNAPNPLLRDRDFVTDIYSRLVGRAPTVDELATSLVSLDGKLESRSSFVADLLQSEKLQTATIVSLIYLTMTGEYPDATELSDAINTLTAGGTGATDVNALTTALVPEYESRFAALNNSVGFITQLFKNKHSGISPTAQSLVSLYNTLTGGARSIDDDGVFVVPGYSGDTISFTTQFALDNAPSQFIGSGGLPLSSVHYYSMPNNPADDSAIAILISALLGIKPSDTEITALSSVSLADAVTSVLTDSRYYTKFPTSSTDGLVAQIMAGFGVFDASLVYASDDADGDGVSNYLEILLSTDPSDGSVAPTVVDIQVAQIMLNLGTSDPDKIAADDDADSDGVSNYLEILLSTDPTDGSAVPTSADSFVAQRMIDIGVEDPTMIAADDDADGDGVSNIAEILLNTIPSNTDDEPTATGSSYIDGTDFVFEFVRLKSSLTPVGASVVVECADETFTFAPVSAVDLLSNLSLSVDQTGITSDYERVEYRIDTSSKGCSFFRLSVQ